MAELIEPISLKGDAIDHLENTGRAPKRSKQHQSIEPSHESLIKA